MLHILVARLKPWEGAAWGNMFVIHGEREVEEDIRSGRAISQKIVDQVKMVILTTGMAIRPAIILLLSLLD